MAEKNPGKNAYSTEGKIVMVTGASSGIGRDFCLYLAKSGCKIIAAARRIDRLKSLCDQINSMSSSNDGSVRAVAIELDVASNGDSIDASVDKAWNAFGSIDALINNAGIRGTVKTPLDTPEEEWDANFETNLKGAWLVSKSVCIRMRDAKIGGSVINISSIGGIQRGQLPGSTAYSAAKAGLNTLTKMMALELGMYKIRVNSISPGLFRSEITENLIKKDWLNNVAIRTCPLRTFGTSDPALTSLVRYLILDSSEYVTGNMFIVDAGATLPGSDYYESNGPSRNRPEIEDPMLSTLISSRSSKRVQPEPTIDEQCEPKLETEPEPKPTVQPPTIVMLKLILTMVSRKLVRNPNTYASVLGLVWSLIACRFHIQLPAIVANSIKIMSDTGLGMVMFSLGLFMALQPQIIAGGHKMALFATVVKFIVGPATTAAASAIVGLRGNILRISIVQASLPEGILPFVFAKQFDVHPQILSTAVIFGMLIALPISIVYYIVLGLIK